jgi:glutaredoxin
MEFVSPVLSGYTIYSKSGCVYCIRVKELLRGFDTDIVNCDEYLVHDREGFLDFIRIMAGKPYRTFPMVFLDGVFLGGYTETKVDLDRRMAFSNGGDF